MVEILTFGNVKSDFDRLGVKFRQTYKGKEYGVCEVTDKELDVLCNEPEIEGTWQHGGWRYCEGSNQGKPNKKITINNKEIMAWYQPIIIVNDDEEIDCVPLYKNLLTYLEEEIRCCQPRNICALTKDLAKYNNIKLSELFKIYQG